MTNPNEDFPVNESDYTEADDTPVARLSPFSDTAKPQGPQRYTLWLILEDGRHKELAKAYGSPYWTEMWSLAKKMYGEKNIFIQYGNMTPNNSDV